ncbi:HAD family hydrolase [Paenibacillus gansuensis]|uniref:HAD family hydrolase n=1 Tax=Paenibacillus gansuensis TaxID=306542 RepID=A0ABW5PFX8_9BACL
MNKGVRAIPWKLLVLDMDGTLLNGAGRISEQNQMWIEHARRAGMEIALASGRHIHYVKEAAEQLRITFPIVTNNGCEVWDPSGELIRRTGMSSGQIEWLYRLALEQHMPFRVYAADADFESNVFHEALLDQHSWLMFMFRIREETGKLTLWEKLLAKGGFELSMASPSKLDVNPAGISKGHAVEAICRARGIPLKQVAAIGDGLNDESLLRRAGLGIAMGNAVDEVKAAADWVTADCDSDGVAKAIQYILAQGE